MDPPAYSPFLSPEKPGVAIEGHEPRWESTTLASNHGRAQPLLDEFDHHLRLQNEVTMLRVQLQQLRSVVLRVRDRVSIADAKQMDAIRRNRLGRRPPSPIELDTLYSALQAARDELGLAEKSFTELEFRLVNKEAGLVTLERQVRRLYAEASNKDFEEFSMDLPSNSLQHYTTVDSPIARQPSTVFSFESGSTEHLADEVDDTPSPRLPSSPEDSPQRASLPDMDIDKEESNLLRGTIFTSGPYDRELRAITSSANDDRVEHYAPDLKAGESWRRIGDFTEPEEPELYVTSLPELREQEANGMEDMEFVLTDRLPKALPVFRRFLDRFFPKPPVPFKRWMLHLYHLRATPRDMIKSHSLTAGDVEGALEWMDNSHDGFTHIIHNPPLCTPTGMPSKSQQTT